MIDSYGLGNVAFTDPNRANNNLSSIFSHRISSDLRDELGMQLASDLRVVSDPDMALNDLERFFAVSRNPLSLAALMQRDKTALPILLKIFSTSQYLANLMIKDVESYDSLRMTEGQPVARKTMIEEIDSEVSRIEDAKVAARVIGSYKNREMLRIAFGDIIAEQSLRTVIRQISFLADAICNAALSFALRKAAERFGSPRLKNGDRCRFVILALGKLGGEELNYSSDIDLIMFFEGDGGTDGNRTKSNQEFFSAVVKEFVYVLQESTEQGTTYRVDLRLRPEGSRGHAAMSINAALRYYDLKGRTWERQAYVKARPVAGDLELGREFLRQMRKWIYKPQVSQFEIASIKSLKRRIEQRSAEKGEDTRNVKTGHGGIRDIEFTIQFLQLLHGDRLRTVRKQNTLRAIDRLQRSGCLTIEERSVLEQNYIWLRKVEHRLQIMFNLQTHSIPESEKELTKLAIRMGYSNNPRTEFIDDLTNVTTKNRRILDHLLHNAFGTESHALDAQVVDLILHTDPDDAHIEQALVGFQFKDLRSAYKNLVDLANENNPFLSTIRCRHFLASIAPRLLSEISKTPEPDATIVALNRVSDSVGGKSTLWELFHSHHASLQLFVRLCAASPTLTELITSNPGMIDDLMDALVLSRLPQKDFLRRSLSELIVNAEDIDPILNSFKSSMMLNIGTRDLLGQDQVFDTFRSLSDVAEVCIEVIADKEFERLIERHGRPLVIENGQQVVCGFSIIGLGKLGGQELNYHSDLDIVFVYQADGSTDDRGAKEPTSNQHFFHQLASAITKRVSSVGPYGRLYELDNRLRPTGKSGALAVSLDQLHRYHASGEGQLWERQAFCKARPIYGSSRFKDDVEVAILSLFSSNPWKIENRKQIREMRMRTEDGASDRNIKRGFGGTMDIEFLVQMLQMENIEKHPNVRIPNTFSALQYCKDEQILSQGTVQLLIDSYEQFRLIESRLHLMNRRATHDLPESKLDQARLEYLLGDDSGEGVYYSIAQNRLKVRECFIELTSV